MKELPEKLDILRALHFPDRCCLCGKVIEHKTKICKSCRKNAPVIRGVRCLGCGKAKKDCKCKGKANFYDGIAAPFYYTGVVRKGIALWKFRDAERSVNFFAEMLYAAIKEAFDDTEFDIITFIPQTGYELEDRGYNQCERLAEALSERMNIRVLPLLKKLYETKRQRNLHPIERSGNIFGVFDCIDIKNIENKTILLVDDIRTSGKTINECAKMLHLCGAKNVFCAVIAVV